MTSDDIAAGSLTLASMRPDHSTCPGCGVDLVDADEVVIDGQRAWRRRESQLAHIEYGARCRADAARAAS